MKTYVIHTLGCKINQYESQQIRRLLEQSGLSAAVPSQKADIIVVNTCCVTHIASAKSRQSIRKLQSAHPTARLIVTGCLPVGQGHELNNLPDILVVKDKNNFQVILDHLFPKQAVFRATNDANKPLTPAEIKDKSFSITQISADEQLKASQNSHAFNHIHTLDSGRKTSIFNEPAENSSMLPTLDRYEGQCRAFLKVQDGCDAWCTYCIIPKIRTNVSNKPVKTALNEAKSLIFAGHKEIVLTGIFLGAYGQTTARRNKWDPVMMDSLAILVDKTARLEGLERLRLSSLEPLDVTDRLLDVMTSHKNIMPHLHMALQSGSGNVLRKMARQYTIDQFMEVIDRVKKTFDRPAITTDIIVGFPGETEADFQQTMDIAKKVGFAKIHVFSFSPRRNTPAIKMAKLFGRVDPTEIKRRSLMLQKLDRQLQKQFRQSCSGLTENVLIEQTHPPKGRCTRYFMVDLSGYPDIKQLNKGQTVDVTIP